jgi:hypothetical protein
MIKGTIAKRRSEAPDPSQPSDELETEPRTVLNGTRSTYFTNMSTNSYKSRAVVSKRKLLNDYLDIKLRPSKIVFQDYQVNETQMQTFTVFNASSRIQHIILSNTKTKEFQFAKNTPLNEFSISPGLEKTITVVFNAGPAAELKTLTDSIEIYVRGGKERKLEMNAFPPVSDLRVPEKVDFGTLLLNEKVVSEIKKSIQSQTFKFDVSSVQMINEGWVQKSFVIENHSKKSFNFTCSFLSKGPLKVEPDAGTIPKFENGCPGKITVNVLVLPAIEGRECHSLQIKILQNDLQSEQDVVQQTASINILTNVIRCRFNIEHVYGGQKLLETSKIDFGNVYYGQKIKIPILLENNCGKITRWAISFTENIKGKRYGDELVLNPMEGVIHPNESCIINFQYMPNLKTSTIGFKSNPLHITDENHLIPMNLQIIDEDASRGELNNAEIIDFSVHARSIPLEIELSKNHILFPDLSPEEYKEEAIVMTNRNEFLPVSFMFRLTAHFHINPPTGVVKPGDSVRIVVKFQPRQLGLFHTKVYCELYSMGAKNLEAMGIDYKAYKTLLKKLALGLSGSCRPKEIVKMLDTDMQPNNNNIFVSMVRAEMEWSAKLKHRQKYIDYIRNGLKKSDRWPKKIASLESDVKMIMHADTELKRITMPDSVNGLLPPEPIEYLESTSSTGNLKRENRLEAERKQLAFLLEKLMELNNQKYRIQSNVFTIPSDYGEEYLSRDDLNKIFTSRKLIDFGTMSVHSVTSLSFSFLNAISSQKGLKISMSLPNESNDGLYTLQIFPESIFLPYHGMNGFEVTLKAKGATTIRTNLNYFVNNRYVFQVPVEARLIPIDLTPSTDKLVIQLKNRYIPVKNIAHTELQAEDQYFTKLIIKDVEYSIPGATKSFTLQNNGSSAAWFSFEHVENESEKALQTLTSLEGRIIIENTTGKVDPGCSERILVRFIPGLKPFHLQPVLLKIIDKTESEEGVLVKTIPISIIGEGSVGECQLLLSSKQGLLDFGIIPAIPISKDRLELYDPELTQYSRHWGSKLPLFGSKSFRIKNNGDENAYFVAFSNISCEGLSIKPNYGIIPGGQTVEINVQVIAISKGSFEDFIYINLIGGGKSFKVPIKYEGRVPQIEFYKVLGLNFKEIIIGSSSIDTYAYLNKGTVMARLVFDLRNFPDVTLHCREERTGGNSGAGNRTVKSASSYSSRNSDRVLKRLNNLNSAGISI